MFRKINIKAREMENRLEILEKCHCVPSEIKRKGTLSPQYTHDIWCVNKNLSIL